MKWTWKIISLLLLILTLASCNTDATKDIKGHWRLEMNGITTFIISFGETTLNLYSIEEQDSIELDYNIENIADKSFIINGIDPNTAETEKFLEGKFANQKVIELTYIPSIDDNEAFEQGKIVMIKVRHADKAIEIATEAFEEEVNKQKKESEEEAAKQQIEEEQEQKAQEERDQQTQKEIKKEQKKVEKDNKPVKNSSTKEKYQNEIETLKNEILNHNSAEEPGFYGQYYTEWDDLLQELWGVLEKQMPKEKFEKLRVEQREWIKDKEAQSANWPDETARSRLDGADFPAIHTTERVDYLVENYLE